MRILITGATGLMGLNACALWRASHDVVATTHLTPMRMQRVRSIPLDVCDADAVATAIATARPDIVLHTAGLTNVDACEIDPLRAERLNSLAAEYVARASAKVRARLIHVSTDHLFDGQKAHYLETDTPAPLNVYARTKLEAERRVRSAHPAALIVRTNFFGWGHRNRTSFSDWIISALRAGASRTLFDDVFITPMLVTDVVRLAFGLAARGESGIYNVAGGERLSKYGFARVAAEVFGLNAALLIAATVASSGLAAPRPRDMSLDTSKAAAALHEPMPDAKVSLTRLLTQEREALPQLLDAAFE